ncbi:hypothetical protein D3C81_1980390 [compost metagenome]
MGMLTKNLLDGIGLVQIIELSRGPVRIDVVDIPCIETCLFDSLFHRHRSPQQVLGRGSDVVGIRIVGVAADLGIDRSASLECLIQVFQNQYGAAF